MKIRGFVPEDAPRLSQIYEAAVRERAARSYTPEQIDAWLTLAPSPAGLERLYRDGRRTFIATEEDDAPIGFSDLEPTGRIHMLYVAPLAAGRGVGAALLGAIEDAARMAGLKILRSEASEEALRVFTHAGFREVARRDLTIADVAIHNYAVLKTLGPNAASPRQEGFGP